MIHVTTNGLDSAVQRLSNFNTGRLQRALTQAVRRTLKAAKSDAAQRVAARYTIAAGRVTSSIKIRASGLSGAMTSTGQGFPMKFFVMRPQRRPRRPPPGGVFVQMVRSQGGMLSKAFVHNGHPFARVGKSRLPIKKYLGASAPGMLKHPTISSFILSKMEQRIGNEISQAAASVL